MHEIVCRKCHYTGERQLDSRGSTALEVFLWLCLIFPGVLYSRWRDRSVRSICPECRSENVIPADQHRGHEMF